MKTPMILLALLLMGCSAVTSKLDDATGTTKAQRCVDYQGALATAVALQSAKPTPGRAERITFYRVFIEANCP